MSACLFLCLFLLLQKSVKQIGEISALLLILCHLTAKGGKGVKKRLAGQFAGI